MRPRTDRPWAAWLRRHEFLLLALVGIVAGSVWVFVELADEVREGEIRTVDEALLLALRTGDDRSDPIGPEWIEGLARDATALGSTGILSFFTLAVCGFLLLDGKRRSALLVLVAAAGGALLSSALKLGFGRPRPDLVPHEAVVYTASFPSGHAMLSAVVYLTLGALLARTQAALAIKAYVLVLAVLLTLMVGVSRVYLGVHWPSDVLAGWTAGAGWAAFCWVVALYLQRHGEIEPESPAAGSSGSSGRAG